MTEEDVVEFLLENPEFLDAHVDILSKIRIPDPHNGRAIPIAERQLTQLRERNTILEQKLHELISFGEENDAIGARMQRITLALLSSATLENALGALYNNLREDFAVPHVGLRLWESGNQSGLIEFSAASEELRVFASSLTAPYCTREPMFDSIQWFGETPSPPRSFAYVALGENQPRGLLALASDDEDRFYPEMGTLYLQRLGEIASAAISRYI